MRAFHNYICVTLFSTVSLTASLGDIPVGKWQQMPKEDLVITHIAAVDKNNAWVLAAPTSQASDQAPTAYHVKNMSTTQTPSWEGPKGNVPQNSRFLAINQDGDPCILALEQKKKGARVLCLVWNGTRWKQMQTIPAPDQPIKIATFHSINAIWFLLQDNSIHFWNGKKLIPQQKGLEGKTLQELCVAYDGRCFALVQSAGSQSVFVYADTAWKNYTDLPEKLFSLQAGKTDLYALGRDKQSNSTYVQQFNDKGGTFLPGAPNLTKISVATDESIIGIDDSNALYQWRLLPPPPAR
jgi:hypothetical protein